MSVEVVVVGADAAELAAVREHFGGTGSPVVVVSRLFVRAVRAALAAAAATDGLVDPTLGLAIEAARRPRRPDARPRDRGRGLRPRLLPARGRRLAGAFVFVHGLSLLADR